MYTFINTGTHNSSLYCWVAPESAHVVDVSGYQRVPSNHCNERLLVTSISVCCVVQTGFQAVLRLHRDIYSTNNFRNVTLFVGSFEITYFWRFPIKNHESWQTMRTQGNANSRLVFTSSAIVFSSIFTLLFTLSSYMYP